jgi:hypothetical protein
MSYLIQAIFQLAQQHIENWMPIKCQRVSEQEVGAKGPLWGSESTPVDLGLKAEQRGLGKGGILVTECKVLECGWVVVY